MNELQAYTASILDSNPNKAELIRQWKIDNKWGQQEAEEVVETPVEEVKTEVVVEEGVPAATTPVTPENSDSGSGTSYSIFDEEAIASQNLDVINQRALNYKEQQDFDDNVNGVKTKAILDKYEIGSDERTLAYKQLNLAPDDTINKDLYEAYDSYIKDTKKLSKKIAEVQEGDAYDIQGLPKVDFNKVKNALGNNTEDYNNFVASVNNLDQVSDYIEKIQKEKIKPKPMTISERAAGSFLVNLPLGLENAWETSKATAVDLIDKAMKAMGNTPEFLIEAKAEKNPNSIEFVDPETNKRILFSENPDKWKSLKEKRLAGEDILSFMANYENLPDFLKSESEEQIGRSAENYIINQFKKSEALNKARIEVGTIVKDFDITKPFETKFASGGELLGGIFEAFSGIISTAIPAALTRGGSIMPQIAAPMYVDYNVEKAKRKYGDNSDSINKLVRNGETEVITPLGLASIAAGLEYVGFKGIAKNLIGKTGIMKPVVSMVLTQNKEGVTELGQLGIETLNESLGSGKSLSDSMVDALKTMASKKGVNNYLMGVIGSGLITGPSTIGKALITETEVFNTAAKHINTISSLQLQRSQNKNKDFRRAIDIQIQETESSLKNLLENTNKLANTMTKNEQSEVLDLLNKKSKNNKTLEGLNNSFKRGELTAQQYGSAKGALVNKNKKLSSEVSRVLANANARLIDKEVEVVEKFAGKENTNVFETTKEFVEATGQDADVDAYIDPDGKIFINKQRAAEVGAVTAGSHELFHRILRQAFSDPDMAAKLVLDFKSILSEKEKAIIQKRIDENYAGESSIIKDEEYLTSFSDAIGKGELKWSDNLTETFMRLAKPILNIFRGKGYGKLEFESGRDVYDFIKDYQKNIKKGKISERAELVMATGEDVTANETKESKTEISKQNLETAKENLKVEEEIINIGAFKVSELQGEDRTRIVKKLTNLNLGLVKNLAAKAANNPNVQGLEKGKRKTFQDFEQGYAEQLTKIINNYEPIVMSGKDAGKRIPFGAYLQQRLKLRYGNVLTDLKKGEVETTSIDTKEAKEITDTPSVSKAKEVDTDVKLVDNIKINKQPLSTEFKDKVRGFVTEQLEGLDPKSEKFRKQAFKPSKAFVDLIAKDIIGSPKKFREFLNENPTFYKGLNITELIAIDDGRIKKGQPRLFTEVNRRLTKQSEIEKFMMQGRVPYLTTAQQKAGANLYNRLTPKVAAVINNFFGSTPSNNSNRKRAIAKAIANKFIAEATPSTKAFKAKPQDVRAKTAEKLQVSQNAKFSKTKAASEINIFLENQTFEKVADELAADNKQWKYIAKTIGVDVISAKKPEDVAKMQEWVRDVLAPRISKSFFTNGTFANAGVSAAKRNFFFTTGIKTKDGSIGELGVLLQDAVFGKDNENISRAVNRQTYVTGGQSGKISEKFIKKFNTKEFKKEQQQKLDGLKDIFKVFETLMKEDKSNASFIIALLGSTSQGMGHFVRTSAPVKFYAKDVSSGIVEEHTMPASLVAKYLFNSAYAGTLNKDFKGIENNYFQGALPFADDKKLKGIKPDGKPFNYTAMTPEGWKITDNIWARYFNINVGLTGGGIDPSNIVLSNGKTVYETYSITSTGVKVDAEAKLSRSKANDLDSDLVPKAIAYDKPVTTQTLINALAKTDKALNNARKLNTPVKKIRVFDFDDTLATSKSMVIVNMPDGSSKKINATQFAKQAADLEANGAEFDFIEFSKVVDGKKGPLFSIAQKIADAKGTEDVFILTARPQEAAGPIRAFMKANGIDIPLANITGLGDGTAQAKAGWMMGKAAEGYNDFYFADDAIKNVQAVKEVLSQVDVKSKVQLAKFSKTKTFDTIVNDMIEDSSGIEAFKEYSAARAKTVGANKGRFQFFIPPSAEDFTGLLYKMLGKGKVGDAQMAFLKTNLLDPYDRAESAVTQAKIAAANDFKALKQNLKTLPKSLSKPTGIGGFTFSHAIRVAAWTKQGMSIPGLSKRDIKELNDFVENNDELNSFTNELIVIQKGKSYPKPGDNWLGGNITSDIINDINKVNRAEYQQEWRENVDIIFSEANMNKMEAAYGTRWRESMEDSLRRMKSGSNRPPGGNRATDGILDWLNNSVGAVMFLNTRSALLQTISAVNFINWGDNNIVKAGAAFANQKQFWGDFMTLMNSDYLVERRNGLKINVSESEIADAVRDSGNKVKSAIAFLLSKGFVMTRFADSFAIATGGSTFYRNRVKALVGKGMEQKSAEAQAFADFRQIAEESQQSSNPNRISQQQASGAGRVILAWANTPMQYARIQKRAAQDLASGRGDWRTNVSKIVYYGAIQNLIFNSLQQAVFALGFGEDDEEEQDAKKSEKISRVANGMIDSQLKGLGIGGAAVVAVKSALMELGKQHAKDRSKYEEAVFDLLGFSPPLGSKIQKINGGLRSFSWNMKDIKDQGFSLDNPAYLAGAQITTGLTNIPIDRVIKKLNSMRGIVNEQSALWQKVALGLGWSTWDVGLGYYGGFDAAKVLTPEEEKVKEIDDMKKLTKTKEQIDMLLDLGLTKKEIKGLGKEQARVEKIIELQNAEAKPKEEAKVKEEIKEETKPIAKPKIESAEKKLRRQFDSIKGENKPEQVKSLLGFGLSKKEIRALKYEKDRVEKILELMPKNK